MLDQIMKSPSLSYAQRGMAAATLRHEVISNNIANVNTPNFKKSEVVFEDLLAREIYGPDGNNLPLVRTHDRHLPVPMRTTATPEVQVHEHTTMRADSNNVDVDVEMASMAKNQLYYNALATQASGYISKLKSVMQGNQ